MVQAFVREGYRLLVRLIRVLGPRLVIAACLLLCAVVVIRTWQALWFVARSSAVSGTVVRQEEIWEADWQRTAVATDGGPRMARARRLFQSVVSFTFDGREYELVSERRGLAHVYPIGTTQVVVFPPGEPQRARLRAELPEFWAQAGMLLMGTVLAAGALRWWWRTARRRRPRFTRRPHRRTG